MPLKSGEEDQDRLPIKVLGDRKKPPVNHIHNVYDLKVHSELIRYYHAVAGFITKPTWIKAIGNRHYSTWKGLTTKAISKHFTESEETWKGHGRNVKPALQSTKLVLKQEIQQQLTKHQEPQNTVY